MNDSLGQTQLHYTLSSEVPTEIGDKHFLGLWNVRYF